MPHAPPINFFCATEAGVFLADSAIRNTPLPMDREGKTDAGPCFGDYFDAIASVLPQDDFSMVLKGAEHGLGKKISLSHVRELKIVAEKHGAFYHPARVEVITHKGTAFLAANVALSEAGKALAEQEIFALQRLEKNFSHIFAPRVFGGCSVPCPWPNNKKAHAKIFLCQWFEEFYEFHLSLDKDKKNQKILVWDNAGGHYFPDKNQTEKIYEQAAKILAYYYNTQTFEQIFSWHHAAGDFVVKAKTDSHKVRLITVRQYDSMFGLKDSGPQAEFEAGLIFLANLTMRMRLDRFDGTGDLAWAGDTSIPPVVRGFFSGLALRSKELGQGLDFAKTLFSVCKEMDAQYWENACCQLVLACDMRTPDAKFLKRNLAGHAKALAQSFSKVGSGLIFVDKG